MLHQGFLILEDGGIMVNPSTIRLSRQNFRSTYFRWTTVPSARTSLVRRLQPKDSKTGRLPKSIQVVVNGRT